MMSKLRLATGAFPAVAAVAIALLMPPQAHAAGEGENVCFRWGAIDLGEDARRLAFLSCDAENGQKLIDATFQPLEAEFHFGARIADTFEVCDSGSGSCIVRVGSELETVPAGGSVSWWLPNEESIPFLMVCYCE
jgi:hypothetical protein